MASVGSVPSVPPLSARDPLLAHAPLRLANAPLGGPATSRSRRLLSGVVALLGLVLMVAQAPFFVSIALTAPLPARVGLGACWLLQFTCGVHWRTRPAATLVLAAAMALTWYVLGVLAAPQLGWTIEPLG